MTQGLTNGFPSIGNEAPRHKRYIGLYHYSYYWNKWDKIVGYLNNQWIVEDHLTGVQRTHSTPLAANHFADKPFKVFSNTPI